MKWVEIGDEFFGESGIRHFKIFRGSIVRSDSRNTRFGWGATLSVPGDSYSILEGAETAGEAQRFCEFVARSYD
jgi:hypothetical protein